MPVDTQMVTAFQSTLSVRRATVSSLIVRGQVGISIHALRKESDPNIPRGTANQTISIHALRKESDLAAASIPNGIQYFNPRSP